MPTGFLGNTSIKIIGNNSSAAVFNSCGCTGAA